MARRTPKAVVKIIERHRNQLDWIDEAIYSKLKVPVENQTSIIREHSVEHWEAMAEGHNHMLESVLMEFNCYHGYHYRAVTRVVEGVRTARRAMLDDPEFKEWRREYVVR